MIDFNKVKDNEELEDASRTLPNKTKILGIISPIFAFDSFFVPYSQSREINSFEILSYNQSHCWGNIFDDFCELYFDKVPKHFEFIDLYFQNVYETDFARDCSILFAKKNNLLFSYNYKSKNHFNNMFLGTFGRVSNGWKFYPIFKEYNERMDMVLNKYGR